MADRPYLTSAEAATYCGFKTIGGIQQAVRRGKLKPAGRRGGTGTYVFAKEDLDAFLTGGLQPHERLFVPPELNEAARLVAARPPAAATRARARPPSGSTSEATVPPVDPAPRSAAPAPLDSPSPRKSQKKASDSLPPAEPAGSQAPRPAPRPSPRPAARGRKLAAPKVDDPVARIVQALSGATRKLEKNAKRSR